MLLKEIWSPIGSPKIDNSEIDWIDDLKFYIDDHDYLLNQFLMPAIEKHKKHLGHPDAYKIYIKPLGCCAEDYCNKLGIDEIDEIFTQDRLEELARTYANLQEKFIGNGDYNKDRK